MINFIEGQINFGENNLLVVSDEELNALAEEGIIEKREDRIGNYYYAESEVGNMKFGVFFSSQNNKINYVRLSLLDSLVKGWDDVSDKAMMDEYHLLSNFVEKEVGSPPDNKKNRKCTWRFKWGRVDVTYEPRAYQADIFMEPW